jgi:hypothetical protein
MDVCGDLAVQALVPPDFFDAIAAYETLDGETAEEVEEEAVAEEEECCCCCSEEEEDESTAEPWR